MSGACLSRISCFRRFKYIKVKGNICLLVCSGVLWTLKNLMWMMLSVSQLVVSSEMQEKKFRFSICSMQMLNYCYIVKYKTQILLQFFQLSLYFLPLLCFAFEMKLYSRYSVLCCSFYGANFVSFIIQPSLSRVQMKNFSYFTYKNFIFSSCVLFPFLVFDG